MTTQEKVIKTKLNNVPFRNHHVIKKMKPDKTGWDYIQSPVSVLFFDWLGKPHKSRI